MYVQGLGVAILVAVLALLLPVLWLVWWWIADLGDPAKSARHLVKHG